MLDAPTTVWCGAVLCASVASALSAGAVGCVSVVCYFNPQE